MCISFYCVEPNNSDYKLILTFNRDEYLARPTSSAKWENCLLAGWDQAPGREGGTWLGVDKSGKIGFLTNIYGVVDPQAEGRGRLVVNWLKGQQSAEEYLEQIKASQTIYAPFNLVLFEPGKGVCGTGGSTGTAFSPSDIRKEVAPVWNVGGYNVWQYTKGRAGHTDSFGPECVSLGIHGISNHPHHQDYQKTEWGRKKIEGIMRNCLFKKESELVGEIEEMMSCTDSHWPDPQIQKQSDRESKVYPYRLKLASVFIEKIEGLNYGTRTTTTVLVDRDNNVLFREKTWEDDEWKITEEKFKF